MKVKELTEGGGIISAIERISQYDADDIIHGLAWNVLNNNLDPREIVRQLTNKIREERRNAAMDKRER